MTGLLGDGRSELFRTVFGDMGRYAGQIYLNERRRDGFAPPRRRWALGIGYVPRNRKENGIIKDMSILENGSIVTLAPAEPAAGCIDRKKRLRGVSTSSGRELDIKMESPDDLHHQPVRRQPAEGGAGQMAQRPARRC